MSENLQIPPLNASSLAATFILLQTSENNDRLTYLKRHHPSYSHLNWTNADSWLKILPPLSTKDYHLLCREACNILVTNHSILITLACYGRERLVSNLSDDEIQVFRDARLL